MYQKIDEHDIFALSAQLSYYLLLAFFPLIIFLISILTLYNSGIKEFMEILRNVLPLDVYKITEKLLTESSYKSIKIISISFVTTVFAASSGFAAVMKLLNKASGKKECRGYFKLQLISIALTFFFAGAIIIVLSLMVFGKVNFRLIMNLNKNKIYYETIWNIISSAITILMLFISFLILYRYAPCKRPSIKCTIIVSLWVTVIWVITSKIFSWYIENVAAYSKLYGSIGGVVVFMLWLYINNIVILIGGEKIFD